MGAVLLFDALLLCDAAEREPTTGKWSLSGIFDVVWVARFPAMHESLHVYFRFRARTAAAAGEHELRVVCRDPTGASAPSDPVAVQIPEHGVVEGAARFFRLRLAQPGDYRFVFELDGRDAGSTVLTVAQLPAGSQSIH
jgi:hypothetical protein